MTELYAFITGRVQGVSFRDYVQVSAGKLGLTGFVRNNRDGSVAVVAHGIPDDLKLFDVTGKEIYISDKITSLENNFNLINVEDIDSGIYYLQLFNRTEKISIIH